MRAPGLVFSLGGVFAGADRELVVLWHIDHFTRRRKAPVIVGAAR